MMVKYVVECRFRDLCSKKYFDIFKEANRFAASEWDFLGKPERERYRIQVLAVERTAVCIDAKHIDDDDWYRWNIAAFIPKGAACFGIKIQK